MTLRAASSSTGAPVVPVLTPYFAGTMAAANLAIAQNVFTKCPIDNVQFDNMGWWDAGNKRYTPQRAGKYMAVYEAVLGAASGSGPTLVQAAVYFNGAAFTTRAASFNGTAFLCYQNPISCSLILNCNGTTDYIEPFAWVQGGTSWIIQGVNTNQFLVTYLGT